jgi:hypothetical protein
MEAGACGSGKKQRLGFEAQQDSVSVVSLVMKVIIDPGQSNNVIATIAIGDSYYQSWHQHAFPTWKAYCERHELGLVVFDADLIARDDPFWKKPTWQKMLIGNVLSKQMPSVRNVCYLDTDILVNPTAPNVFDAYDPATIGLVSLRKNLPYPYEQVLRRVAFLRNKYYDSKYPLDSALFISVGNLYKFHGLPVQADEACAGMFVFNIENHADLLGTAFLKYDRSIDSITGGGDQTHFNYEVQSCGKVSWLDYRFQAIWLFEMAWKYPFLYDYGRDKLDVIKECVEASLFTNYFLHFAGTWHESGMWKIGGVLGGPNELERFNGFVEYLKSPVSGMPLGQIKP